MRFTKLPGLIKKKIIKPQKTSTSGLQNSVFSSLLCHNLSSWPPTSVLEWVPAQDLWNTWKGHTSNYTSGSSNVIKDICYFFSPHSLHSYWLTSTRYDVKNILCQVNINYVLGNAERGAWVSFLTVGHKNTDTGKTKQSTSLPRGLYLNATLCCKWV